MLKKISHWFSNWRHKETLPLKLDNYWVFEVTENGKTERKVTRVKGIAYFREALFFQLEGYGCDEDTFYRNNEKNQVEKIFYFKSIWDTGVVKLITSPGKEGYLYIHVDKDENQNGGEYASAVADDSVINGFQCTSVIEETTIRKNEVVHKMRCWWGDGIGYIKIQYFRPGTDGEFSMYCEQVLVEAKLW